MPNNYVSADYSFDPNEASSLCTIKQDNFIQNEQINSALMLKKLIHCEN